MANSVWEPVGLLGDMADPDVAERVLAFHGDIVNIGYGKKTDYERVWAMKDRLWQLYMAELKYATEEAYGDDELPPPKVDDTTWESFVHSHPELVDKVDGPPERISSDAVYAALEQALKC